MKSPVPALVLLLASVSLLGAGAPPRRSQTRVSVAARAQPSPSLDTLAAAAIAGDKAAIAALREAGPPGLEAVFRAGHTKIAALRNNTSRLEAPENANLRAALDGVARQRDAYASGLYWYTDLEAAKAEAKRTGRLILSLRLLGNLDDEFSCANSRFFRTALYANHAVSALLRRGYVLHWKSVRPVPVLTIDMGDGRRIKRTITGNSIHYILDFEGQVHDALPGNYGPAAFVAALARIEAGTYGCGLDQLRRWHGYEARALCDSWLHDAVHAGLYGEKAAAALEDAHAAARVLQELKKKAFPETAAADEPAKKQESKQKKNVLAATPDELPATSGYERFGQGVTQQMNDDETAARFAALAMKRLGPGESAQEYLLTDSPAVTRLFPRVVEQAAKSGEPLPEPQEFDPPKAMVERPLMRQAQIPTAEAALDPAAVGGASSAPLAHVMNTQWWAKIAKRYEYLVSLDDSSRRLMIAKLPESMFGPEEIKQGFGKEKSPFRRMQNNFQAAIAREMVRNEYYFHTLIHQWLEEDASGTLTNDVEVLNKRVYAELFLTPDYDEWLGLVPEDTYTALEKDGCACDKGAPPMNTTKKAK